MKLYDRKPDPDEVPLPAAPPAGISLRRGRRPSPRAFALAGAAALGLVMLMVLAIALQDRAGPPADAAAKPAMTVTLARVARADWDSTLEASGAIEPWQEAVLGAQSSGLRLLEVRANVGDTVKRGQVLARFDASLLRAGQAELLAALAQADAAARQAAINRQRMQALRDSGGVSQQDVLQYETQAETSAAQAAVVRAQLESRRLLLDHAEVLAPDDGVISARSATVGAVAESGQELFRLIRQGRLEWRGELTAGQLARIAPGQRIALRLPDGSAATAQVRQSAPRLDPQSRLATVYADIDRGSAARAGMYAAGRVVLERRPALVVPAASVVIRDGHSFVFRLDADTGQSVAVAQAVRVEAGRRQGALVEIIDNVAEGETLVEQGAGFLKDGDAVRIVAPVNATAPTPKKG